MALNHAEGPAVIVAASGMCTAGRVKHHLKHGLEDPRNTVLFVGYQAAGSLGRLIQSGHSPVRIFGEWYQVKARVETIQGFSAHADRDELLAWFEALGGVPRRTFVVHGEEDALRERFRATVDVPVLGETFELS
jgi:metallo-beta-lactamase family protein